MDLNTEKKNIGLPNNSPEHEQNIQPGQEVVQPSAAKENVADRVDGQTASPSPDEIKSQTQEAQFNQQPTAPLETTPHAGSNAFVEHLKKFERPEEALLSLIEKDDSIIGDHPGEVLDGIIEAAKQNNSQPGQ